MKFLHPLLLLSVLPIWAFSASEDTPLRKLVDGLTPEQTAEAIEKIHSTGLKSGTLDAAEMEKARLQGLLERLGPNARLLPSVPDATTSLPQAFRSEMLPRSVVYLRLGDLTPENVKALAEALTKQAKSAAAIFDLRATRQGASYDLAAQVVNDFAPPGVSYFQIVDGRTSTTKDFTGSASPLFTGLLVVLVNQDCSGPAEALAAALRQQARAILVGTATVGQAVEYVAQPLGKQAVLQIAVARVVLSGAGKELGTKGVQPDLAVTVEPAEEQKILQATATESVAKYIFEAERAHMNEASLVAGRNPEIDAYQSRVARGNSPEPSALLDRTLQRALDTITSVLVYRAPKTPSEK